APRRGWVPRLRGVAALRRSVVGRVREVADGGRHGADARGVGGVRGVAVELGGEAVELFAPRLSTGALGAGERGVDRAGASRGQPVVANELIQVGADDRERGRPLDARLALWVVLLEACQLRGFDLVGREVLGGLEL